METPDQTTNWDILKSLIEAGDPLKIGEFLENLSSSDTARAISRLEAEYQSKLLTLLEPEEAADLIEDLPDIQAKELIEDLPGETAAAIVEELASDQQADLLGSLPAQNAEAILQEMDPEDARDARQLLAYSPDTAGGLMITEFLAYRDSQTVSEIVDDIRNNSEKYSTFDVFYAYIVSEDKKLQGVVRIRDLILNPAHVYVEQVMIKDPIFVRVDASLSDLNDVFDKNDFFGIPVCDRQRRLVGVVKRSSLREAIANESDKTFLQASGILGGEELRNAPLRERAIKRFIILVIKIGLNLISASVIAANYNTLSAVVALAVFLPIISDMGGSSGNQSVAVSIRELTLGIIRPSDLWIVVRQELKLGVLIGSVLGIILGTVAWLWKDNIFLGLVIGISLFLNTIISVAIGGMIPMVLTKLRLDPAVASSAILTTITDSFGFFVVLTLASFLLSQLTLS